MQKHRRTSSLPQKKVADMRIIFLRKEMKKSNRLERKWMISYLVKKKRKRKVINRKNCISCGGIQCFYLHIRHKSRKKIWWEKRNKTIGQSPEACTNVQNLCCLAVLCWKDHGKQIRNWQAAVIRHEVVLGLMVVVVVVEDGRHKNMRHLHNKRE